MEQTLITRLTHGWSKFLKSPWFKLMFLMISGVILVVVAQIIGKYIESQLAKRAIELLGAAVVVGVLAGLVDRFVFVSEVEAYIGKHASLIEENLSNIEPKINNLHANLLFHKIGINGIYKEGLKEFFHKVIEKAKEGDQIVVLETFIDRITLGNSLTYTMIDLALKKGVKLEIIGLKYSTDTKRPIALRTVISQEFSNFPPHLIQFWGFIAKMTKKYPTQVVARQIDFVPSLVLYLFESPDRKLRSLFFTPLVSGDSETTEYFVAHSQNFGHVLPRKALDYLVTCRNVSTDFDLEHWPQNREVQVLSENEISQLEKGVYPFK